MSRFKLTPRPTLLVAALAATTLAACRDDVPSPIAPPVAASASKTGAGKPSTIETVLFTGVANVNADIYAMNPDGSNVRRLTTDSTLERSPSFSPDNRKIVYVRRREGDGPEQLFTANPDGTKQTPLTMPGWAEAVDNPRYSPDGTKIAFEATVRDTGDVLGDPNTDIFVINADGSGLTRLTYEASEDRQPAWSPDGKTIVFASARAGDGYMSIYTMTAGGLNVRLLVGCTANCLEPEFSPDGTRIAFASTLAGDIAVLTPATNSLVSVGPAPGVGVSRHPTWSRDGTRVVFASDRGAERTMELYAGVPGSSDASTVRRLTVFSPGVAVTPANSH